mmetsp:Transcript_7171/g.15407  ORF Transcript_7171/g.15407 Transcript_7171/m.15407 type:complete len:122 (+) Transcript_7171:510-875(+)
MARGWEKEASAGCAKARASEGNRFLLRPGRAKRTTAANNAVVTAVSGLCALLAKVQATKGAGSASDTAERTTRAASNAVAKAENITAPAQRAMDTAPKKGSVVRRAKEQVKGRARCAMATP